MNFADRLNEAAKYNPKKDEGVFTLSELREANNKLMASFLVFDVPGLDATQKILAMGVMSQYIDLLIKTMKGEEKDE